MPQEGNRGGGVRLKSEVSEPCASPFDPKINDPKGDVVFSSQEGTLYRIHSTILQSASINLELIVPSNAQASQGSFTARNPEIGGDSDAFDEDDDSSPTPLRVVTLPFSSEPIQWIFMMITSKEVPPWTSFAEIEATVEVAEYLQAPGPLSIIRNSCLTQVDVPSSIRAYGLAVKHGWNEVMQRAAALTLHMNLFPDPQSNSAAPIREQINQLPDPSCLYRLVALHQRRRDDFRKFLLSSGNFPSPTLSRFVCKCGWTYDNDNEPWIKLVARLIREFDDNPSGEMILSNEMEEWYESVKVWNLKCTRWFCGSNLLERVAFTKKLRNFIKALPEKV